MSLFTNLWKLLGKLPNTYIDSILSVMFRKFSFNENPDSDSDTSEDNEEAVDTEPNETKVCSYSLVFAS